jgi:predicted amidohydrolase YtcJ
VVANIQPSFVPTDAAWVDKFVPDSVLPYAYLWKTLMKSGIICAGGSDAPVEHPSPIKGLYDAIYRPRKHLWPKSCRPPGGDGEGDKEESIGVYKAEECLTFSEALAMYTLGSAWAGCVDGGGGKGPVKLGRIDRGFDADFTGRVREGRGSCTYVLQKE